MVIKNILLQKIKCRTNLSLLENNKVIIYLSSMDNFMRVIASYI